MKKRIMALAVACMLLITALAGCGTPATSSSSSEASAQGESKQESETTKVETTETGDALKVEFFQQKMEEGPQKGYQAVLEAFMKENPNLNFEMNTVPDAGKVLTTRISSNDVPPVFSDYPTQMQFKKKVENGFVEKISGEDFLTRVNPSAIEMSKANDGETYALPLSNNFMGMYYNIDIFKENNLEIPTTFEELINVCEQLKAKGIAPLGLTYKDPGRVGHMFQAMTVAWTENGSGVEDILASTEGKALIADSKQMKTMAEKMLTLTSYANEDAFGISDTAMWENFANGKYAMCITGSYARGTILIANPDINMGIFPIPNDTAETTTILTGVDAAVCISAKASDAEKEAGLKFFEFITRPENAQAFCDADGAPSCITSVEYKDETVAPVISQIKSGKVHDWMASTIDSNVVTELYNVTQNFLMEKDVDKYLSDMDNAIKVVTAQ